MRPALPFFLLNVLIVGLVLAVIWLSQNPLAILGLYFLQQMPFVPPQMHEDDEEEEGNPIGFVTE